MGLLFGQQVHLPLLHPAQVRLPVLLGIIHAHALHIIEDGFPVLLLFLLDMVQDLAYLGIPEFEDGCIIGAGDVFLRHQHIGAEVLVGLVATGLVLPQEVIGLLG